MKQIQEQKHNLIEIANRLEKSNDLIIYWDYNDKLSEEQIIKIITEEEGLNEVENELYEYNIDYVAEIISDRIKELNLDLTEEEQEDLRLECESGFNFNIEGLIKNSQINLRLELLTNEDMIYYENWKHTDTIKFFKERFKGHYKVKDLEKEFNELTNDYALICFYFRVKGLDILDLREQILKGYISLRKGLEFGLFNSYIGGGSVLEIPLLKEITLNLKDWRFKNINEEVLNAIENKDKGYYKAVIKADNISKYGIQETYGLSSWQEF